MEGGRKGRREGGRKEGEREGGMGVRRSEFDRIVGQILRD